MMLLLLILLTAVQASAQEYPIGLGWAKTSVNTVVFRKNSLVTHGRMQYAAYYDSTAHVVLAKRRHGSKKWELNRTSLTGNTADAHNAISIMVDGAGYLHIAWNHHDTPLNYRKSVAPGSLELTEALSMTGDEELVTYPEFYRMPSGDLLFLYRSGSSGKGDLVMNRYVLATGTWQRVHDVLIDGEGERNAYWQACVDAAGTIHLSWVWRETYDVATNHDLAYARSRDGGVSWEASSGEPYSIPITAASAEYAYRIPQKSELINQTTMTADSQGRPYIASYWTGADGVPQYQLVYHDGTGWRKQQVTHRTGAFTLSGAGTKKIPISRPQLVVQEKNKKVRATMIFRDVERGSRVSVAVNDDLHGSARWSFRDVTDFSVGDWEPTYDTEYWKSKGRLHLFVQRTGQGDGEGMEDVNAQVVMVVED